MLDLSESTFGHFISKKMIENATKNKEKLTSENFCTHTDIDT